MENVAMSPRPDSAIGSPRCCRVQSAGFLLAACLLFFALPAAAATTSASPPPAPPQATAAVVAPRSAPDTAAERVVREYLEAVRRRDWSAATQRIHSAALGRFKGAFVLLAAGDTGKMLVTDLFELPNVEALEQMSEPQLYQRFMERVGSATAAEAASLPEARLEMLGTIAESETFKHIVYRITTTVDGAPLPTVGVLSARRDGANWKVELTSEVEAMIAGIRRGMAR